MAADRGGGPSGAGRGAAAPPVVEFTPEIQDLVALNTFLVGRDPAGRLARRLAAVTVLAACSAAVAGSAASVLRGGVLDGMVAVAAAAALLGLTVGWLMPKLLPRLQARLAFRAAARDALLVPQRLELAPDGLRATSPNGETLTRWHAVREVACTADHVFLLVGPRTAFCAPRRAFADPDAFRAFCRRAEDLHRRRGSGR